MSKGAGGGGAGGKGGRNSAAGGSGAPPSVELPQIVSQHGGVSNMAEIPFRKEFESGAQQRSRSIEYYTGQLANAKTVAEKNAITSTWKPISIGVDKVGGKWQAGLEDGRHRLYSAKKMGATKIKAEITYRAKSGEYRTITAMVKV
jgi:hypothetical protein